MAGSPVRDGVAAALGVTFDGRQFRFSGFRYDRVEDAVAYARLLWQRDEMPAATQAAEAQAIRPSPTAEQQQEMAALGIALREGRYHFGDYVYDSVLDALAYARRDDGSST
jgi:hypothetical protein